MGWWDPKPVFFIFEKNDISTSKGRGCAPTYVVALASASASAETSAISATPATSATSSSASAPNF